MALVGAFVVVLLVTGVMVLLIIRKVGQSKALVQTTRISAARSDAKAIAARGEADKLGQIAEHAMEQTDDALAIASEIKKVSGQMDTLIEHVTTPGQAQQGRHARIELRIVQDGEEGAA